MRSPLARFRLSLSLAAGLAASVVLADSHTSPVWKTDFAAAQAEAKQLNRPLLIHCYGKSCPPCRKMENEVLNKEQVLKALENGYVAVKVCLDNASGASVRNKYSVDLVPTDLVISPEGKVVSRTNGYQSINQYVATLTHWDAKFAAARKPAAATAPAIAKTAPPKQEIASPKHETDKQPKQEVVSKPLPPAAPERAVAAADKLVPPPVEPKKIAEVAATIAQAEPAKESDHELPPAAETLQPLVGLEGYCPVTLRSTRAWKAGSKDFAFDHDGQTFYFATAGLRDEFKSNPRRFAPRLLGCDPVVLSESDLAIRGSVKFGAFYEGELYLFETADTRAKFRKEPGRYARQQHVVKPEDVKRIAAKE